MEEKKAKAEIVPEGRFVAKAFLERKGLEIVEDGWECPAGKVDFIALNEGTLVFIDVNSRRGEDEGLPAQYPTESDRMRLEGIAGFYLAAQDDVVDRRIRFDVVSVLVIPPDRALVSHHINALGGSVDAQDWGAVAEAIADGDEGISAHLGEKDVRGYLRSLVEADMAVA